MASRVPDTSMRNEASSGRGRTGRAPSTSRARRAGKMSRAVASGSTRSAIPRQRLRSSSARTGWRKNHQRRLVGPPARATLRSGASAAVNRFRCTTIRSGGRSAPNARSGRSSGQLKCVTRSAGQSIADRSHPRVAQVAHQVDRVAACVHRPQSLRAARQPRPACPLERGWHSLRQANRDRQTGPSEIRGATTEQKRTEELQIENPRIARRFTRPPPARIQSDRGRRRNRVQKSPFRAPCG